MVERRQIRRWLIFVTLRAGLFAIIWWPAATTTRRFELTYDGFMPGAYGERFPFYKMAPIADPQPPSDHEVFLRRTYGIFFAILGWVMCRVAVRLDRDRDPEWQRTQLGTHSHEAQ
jgi:hypothetical protein